VAKSEGLGVLTAIMHLAPANMSSRNTCPHSSEQCRAACLNTAGRGGIALDSEGLNAIQRARIARTERFHADRATFLADLVGEIAKHERRAARAGLSAAVRLNGTSDLPWEAFPVERDGQAFPNVFAAFPEVRFYDYTKWPVRLRKVAGIANYSLCFSLAETPRSEANVRDALAQGFGAAVVFAVKKGQPLPLTYMGAQVVDGDLHDLRYLDGRGVIAGLRAKGKARGMGAHDGFVRLPDCAPEESLLAA